MAENGGNELTGETSEPSVHHTDKVSLCNGNGDTGHKFIRDDNGSFCSEESIDSPLDFSFKRRNGESEVSGADSPLSPGSNMTGSKSPDNSEHSVCNGLQSNVNHAREAEEIGEPKVASPGTPHAIPPELAGMIQAFQAGMLPASTAANMFGNFPSMAALMDPKISQSNKSTRPFKAYPKEALSLPLGCYGIPGLNPFQSFDTNMLQNLSGEDLLNMYKNHLQVLQEHPVDSKQSVKTSTISSATVTSSNTGLSSQNNSHHHRRPHHHHHFHHNTSAPVVSSPINIDRLHTQPIPGTSGIPNPHHSNSRKRPRTLPDEQKDEAYWERRRKNNDAAKRSRDARRAKEDEIAIRAALLEQENLKLRVEVAALKTETAKLRCMLYNS